MCASYEGLPEGQLNIFRKHGHEDVQYESQQLPSPIRFEYTLEKKKTAVNVIQNFIEFFLQSVI